MKIVHSENFKIELGKIIVFIANDSVNRALEFRNELLEKINKIPDMPYAYVKNSQTNNENVRNLIFKGYTVVFRIAKEQIKILGIFKNNKHKFSAS